MNLNLSKFKKLKESATCATLRHPAGHEIRIAKNVLSPQLKDELSKLPLHYSEGTKDEVVPEEDSSNYASLGAKEEAERPADFETQFPELAKADTSVASEEPQQEAPAVEEKKPAATDEDAINQRIEQQYKYERLQNPGESEVESRDKASSSVLDPMLAKKKQAEDDAASRQKALEASHAFEVQHVENENVKRKALGLSPLPLPTPPIGASRAGPPDMAVKTMVAQANGIPGQMEEGNVLPSAGAVSPEVAPADASASAPSGYPQISPTDYKGNVQQGLQMQGQGIQQGAQAQADLGNAEASIYGEGAKQQQQLFKKHQLDVANNDLEFKNAMADYKAGHIDPNHYLNSRGVASRILTAIGMILAGGGAGVLGQENPVISFLHQQIKNDIDAQAKEMDKNQNLVRAYYDHYGNINQAMSMASAVQSAIVANQVAEAGAKAKGPLAKANAQQAYGQLMANASDQLQKVNMEQYRLDMLGGSISGQGMTPEQRVAFFSQNPAEAEAAGKELAAVKNHAVQQDKIVAAFQKAAAENSIAGRAGRLGFEPPSIGVLQAEMMPYLKDAEGRINEQELVRTDKLIPKPGDQPATVAEKLQGLKSFLQEKRPVAVLLPKYGIDANQFGKLDVSGDKKIKFGPPVGVR